MTRVKCTRVVQQFTEYNAMMEGDTPQSADWMMDVFQRETIVRFRSCQERQAESDHGTLCLLREEGVSLTEEPRTATSLMVPEGIRTSNPLRPNSHPADADYSEAQDSLTTGLCHTEIVELLHAATVAICAFRVIGLRRPVTPEGLCRPVTPEGL